MLDFRNIFRALRNRNYRLFFTGQSLSLVGTWMQQIALSWLVYRMTHSPLLLGVVGFAGQVPAFFISPVAGIIADRYPKRKALVLTQALSMLQASLLAFLVLSNQIAIWHIVVLSIFLGIVNGFDMSIRQAFTIEMVDNKEDLSNAIALNSSIVNLARLIGPSIAGILIAKEGEGLRF
jgi:MFS family permease